MTQPPEPHAPTASAQEAHVAQPARTLEIPPVPPAPGPGRSAQGQGPTFWESLRGAGIRRDRRRGWVGGVCVGLADRLGVDALLIRALAVVLLFTGGVGLIAYLVAWLLLPDTDGQIMLQEAGRGSVSAILLIVALAVLVFSGLSFSDGPFWMGGWLFPAVVIALVAIYLANRGATPHQRPLSPPPGDPAEPAAFTSTEGAAMTTTWATPPAAAASYAPTGAIPPVPPTRFAPPTPPRPQRRRPPKGVGAIVMGLAVLGYGLGLLLDGPLGFRGSGHFLGLLIALGVTSLAAVGLGLAGRRGGLASALTLLLLVPVGLTAVAHKVDLGPARQTVTWVPTSGGGYNIGAGEATLDLGQLTTGEATDLQASVGAGRLTVLVPKDTEVSLTASVGAGSVDLGRFGTDPTGGLGREVRTDIDPNGAEPSPTHVTLRAAVGVGDLVVKEK